MHVVYAPNLDNDPATPGGPRRQYGTAILSKYPILESRNTLLPRPGNGEQRGLLEAVVDVDGLRVRIANTHMSTVASEQAVQVTRIVELLAESKEPVVLLGDLNVTPTNAALAPLWAKYKDSWKLGGVGSSFTFPGNVPDRRIDFIALWTASTSARRRSSTRRPRPPAVHRQARDHHAHDGHRCRRRRRARDARAEPRRRRWRSRRSSRASTTPTTRARPRP